VLDDHALARQLAVDAGRLLVDLRAAQSHLHPELLRDEGDLRAHRFIVDALRAARPDDGVLSEEGIDDLVRLEHRRVWIVDPLDGTREYGDAGRRDWSVHVALCVDGTPVAGAVALPAEDIVLATDVPPLVPDDGDRPPRVVTSRTRRPYAAVRVAEVLGAELVPLGSAGAKAMAVVRGHADAYAHAGGMYEWDSCAPAAVAAAAGLHVSRLDGSPLRYNRADPWLPDLLVCRQEIADVCLEAVRS
jgi:3'(2'), 5'-bisphosphate nucleotidase